MFLGSDADNSDEEDLEVFAGALDEFDIDEDE